MEAFYITAEALTEGICLKHSSTTHAYLASISTRGDNLIKAESHFSDFLPVQGQNSEGVGLKGRGVSREAHLHASCHFNSAVVYCSVKAALQ